MLSAEESNKYTELNKFVIKLSIELNVNAQNEEDALIKVKDQLVNLLKSDSPINEYISIKAITKDDTFHTSYFDDWEFDDIW